MANHANRGQYLEEWIEQANENYTKKGIAVISKIPTPWKVQRSYSPYTRKYQINFAYPEKKSTVDFGGTAASQSVWFDVKATKNKASFPLSNIHKHQIEYLEKVHKQGGKAFMLIHAREFKKTWVLWIDQLFKFQAEHTRKSIPFTWLDENCEQVPSSREVMLDYLPIILRRNEGN